MNESVFHMSAHDTHISTESFTYISFIGLFCKRDFEYDLHIFMIYIYRHAEYAFIYFLKYIHTWSTNSFPHDTRNTNPFLYSTCRFMVHVYCTRVYIFHMCIEYMCMFCKWKREIYVCIKWLCERHVYSTCGNEKCIHEFNGYV